MNKIKNELSMIANQARIELLHMMNRTNSSHIGSCYSIVDILVSLYFEIMHVNPEKDPNVEEDILILSKGHAVAALYVVLALRGYFPIEKLQDYYKDGGLPGHPVKGIVPGIDTSTGSLGHGLSIAIGRAVASNLKGIHNKVFVILGDGECDEGSVWEAANFAGKQNIGNLVAIVDLNGLQGLGKTGTNINKAKEGWASFGWDVFVMNGHDFEQIIQTTRAATRNQQRPVVLIAETTKGKGVSYMEDKLEWHYKSPNDHELKMALGELLK